MAVDTRGGPKPYRALTKASSSTFDILKRASTRLFPRAWFSNRQTQDRMSDWLVFKGGRLVILVVCYNATEQPDTAFGRLMNAQDPGVRVLFTRLGVLLSFFWGSLLIS